MKPFAVEKLEDLADVFCAVIGGCPDNIGEIEEYMLNSRLSRLFAAADMERILKYDGFFADETADAVYAILPTEIRLNENKTIVLTPQAFQKLNRAKINKPASRIINIPFPKAAEVYERHFDDKIQDVISVISAIKQKREEEEREAQRIKAAEEEKKAAEEAKKAERREKNRLRMRKRRAEHPEARKSYYKRLDTLSPEERERQREANNRRNAVYREKNREKLRQSHNECRAKLKAENPELLKEIDKMHNSTKNRKKAGRRYYKKHKKEIAQKARENPMVKVYKRRYKIKQRLKKTGPVLASLLQGIMAAKSRG